MSFDLFLSYHGADRESAVELARVLQARDISTFLDRDQLVPGRPWLPALEQALSESRAVAVLIGPNGMGGWQEKEKDLSLDRQVREKKEGRDFPVIPVLLPNVGNPGGGFLLQNTWVDLRKGVRDAEAIEILLRALEGGASAAQREIQVSPYRGLQSFRKDDGPFFCGRDAAASELLELVLHRDLVTLVGSSGSGKSSLAQAGLLPLLRRQRSPEVWDAVCFSPRNCPFRELAGAFRALLDGDRDKDTSQAIARKRGALFETAPEEVEQTFRRCFDEWPGTDRILVIVDQLEELFTQSQEKYRRPFLAALIAAQETLPLTLLFTLRADFYDLAIGFDPALGKRIPYGQLNLLAMSPQELSEAITKPADLAGLAFEPGLAKRILDDAGEEPGTLPLLELALDSLWEHREGKTLTHRAYEEKGKVAGAIADTANRSVAKLPSEEQPAVRRIFKRLVRVSPPQEGGRPSRLRVPLDALSALEQGVARKLAARRLLVLGRDGTAETVTLAHEALIQHWTQLQGWLAEDQEFLLWHQRLQSNLDQWKEARGVEGALLRGELLSEAERWLKERPAELNLAEQSFIEESAALRKRLEEEEEKRGKRELEQAQALAEEHRRLAEEQTRRVEQEKTARKQAEALAEEQRGRAEERSRANRRLKLALGGLLTLFIALFFVSAQVFRERYAAVRLGQSVTARYLSLRVPGLLANRHQTALLLAIEAFRLTRNAGQPRFPPVEQTLRQALTVFGGRVLGSYRGQYRRIVASPDGTRVAGLGADGKVRAWNLSAADPTKAEQIFEGLGAELARFEISPANRWLLTVTADKKRLVLYRLKERTGSQEISLRSSLAKAVFSPNDRWLALRAANEGIRLFDLDAPGAPERPLPKLDTLATAIAFSPDARWLAIGGGRRVVQLLPLDGGPDWASTAGEEVITALCFGADKLVAADTAGKLKLRSWRDRSTAAEWRELGTPQRFGGRALQVSDDGRWLIVRMRARVAEIWDLATEKQVERFNDVTALTLRGGVLALGERGGIMRIVLGENPEEQNLRTFAGRAIEMGPTGRWLIAGVGDTRSAALWTFPPPGKGLLADLPLAFLGGHDDPVEILGIGADERWALTSGSSGAPPRIWELRSNPAAPTEPELLSLNSPPANVPDPSMLARVHEPAIDQAVASVDRRWLVVSLPPSTLDNVQIHLWDLRPSAPVLHPLRNHREGGGILVFSPDSQLLTTGGKDGVIRLWRLDSSIKEPIVLEPGGGEITTAAFAPDGRELAVAAGDRTVRVWKNPGNLDRDTPASSQLKGPTESLTSLAFGPDSWLAAGGAEGTIYLWNQKIYPNTPIAVKKHNGAVRAISFSGDGRWLMSTDEKGVALRWRMHEDELEHFACQTVGRNLTQREWAEYFPDEGYRQTCPKLPRGD